jgi:hypothetical protein
VVGKAFAGLSVVRSSWLAGVAATVCVWLGISVWRSVTVSVPAVSPMS